MSSVQPVTGEDVFVARQPIFRPDLKVYGYELLYRSGTADRFDGPSAESATSQVIANAFLTIGADKLLNNKLAFINFDASMLTLQFVGLLPFRSVVVEILETVDPTPDVLAACRDLKKRGYLFALDDVEDPSRIEPWVGLVDVVKVDFVKANAQARKLIAQKCKQHRIKLLAEKVENTADVRAASSLKYDYYQGFFFARPETRAGRDIPQSKMNLLRMLREVSREEADLDRVEKLVVQEVSLTYKLLRYLNSAAFGWRTKITSVRHALALLGVEELRKWISLLLLASMGESRPPQIVIDSLIRARFAELLASRVGLARRRSSAFLLGLLSHLDAVLNCPLKQAIADLSLDDDVYDTLLEQTGARTAMTNLYVLMRSYEAADWGKCAAIAREYDIPVNSIRDTYVQAVEWAEGVAAL